MIAPATWLVYRLHLDNFRVGWKRSEPPTEMFAAYLADRSAILKDSVISRETAPSMAVGFKVV
jgi:hypothetical protein